MVTIRVCDISIHPITILIYRLEFHGLSPLIFLKLLQVGFSAAKTEEEIGEMSQ